MHPDLLQGGEAGGQAGAPRRRGRPPGARGKRGQDLVRMIGAVFGSTPGEQLASVGLVTSAEVRRAKAQAKEWGLDAVTAAIAIKARALGRAIGCKTDEAWALLARDRAELMPYVHQRRPQAVELEVSARRTPLVMIPEALGALGPVIAGDAVEIEEDQALSAIARREVSRS